MARVRISEAARLAGVSKSTMHRALKLGRISYETDEKGERWIDPAEVARVYGTVETAQKHDPRHAEARAADPAMERENELLRGLVDDLRRRLDQSEDERRRLSERLLPDQRPWWRRLFNR